MVYPRMGIYNIIKRIQKNKIPILATRFTITSKVEKVKDSPSLEVPKDEKGKEPQEETTTKEEIPLPIKGTSKTKTSVEKLLFATLLELEKAKVDVIKWKRVVEDNKGK